MNDNRTLTLISKEQEPRLRKILNKVMEEGYPNPEFLQEVQYA